MRCLRSVFPHVQEYDTVLWLTFCRVVYFMTPYSRLSTLVMALRSRKNGVEHIFPGLSCWIKQAGMCSTTGPVGSRVFEAKDCISGQQVRIGVRVMVWVRFDYSNHSTATFSL